ncbi:MAG: hypothetical protein ACOC5F_00175 [Candidatus Aminicenantaceae bacterium]
MDEKQSKQLRHILDEYAKRIAEIRKSTQEQLGITNEFFMEEMDRLLTPEQKQAIKAAIEERWEKRKPLILRRRFLKEREGRGFLPRIRRFQK